MPLKGTAGGHPLQHPGPGWACTGWRCSQLDGLRPAGRAAPERRRRPVRAPSPCSPCTHASNSRGHRRFWKLCMTRCSPVAGSSGGTPTRETTRGQVTRGPRGHHLGAMGTGLRLTDERPMLPRRESCGPARGHPLGWPPFPCTHPGASAAPARRTGPPPAALR